MPMNRNLYPPDWTDISHRIRFVRADGKCEQCGAPHNMNIGRAKSDPAAWNLWSKIPAHYRGGYRKIRVILTTAHLDHDPANNDPNNLAALCQRCHLEHDRADNLKRRRANRWQARIEAGQLELIT